MAERRESTRGRRQPGRPRCERTRRAGVRHVFRRLRSQLEVVARPACRTSRRANAPLGRAAPCAGRCSTKPEGFDEGMIRCGSIDNEMSVRLWLEGYELWTVPSVTIAHLFRKGLTIDQPSTRRIRYT